MRTETFTRMFAEVNVIHNLDESSPSTVVGPKSRLEDVKAGIFCKKAAQLSKDSFSMIFTNKWLV